ncbi:uncharacterized protein [Ptychodera flava]
MKEKAPFSNIEHQLDVWHKSTKINAKLSEAANMRGNHDLRKWKSAVRNHFWYSSRTCGGDIDVLKNKWTSILHHVTGTHEWFGGACDHGPINEVTKYLEPDSPPMEALRDIIMDRNLLRSFAYYTKFRHTGHLESFHNTLLMYASKRTSYKFENMKARVLLAAIDHNHHLHRKQATTSSGEQRYARKYSKRSNRWTAVPVKEKKTYSYLPVITALILHKRRIDQKGIKQPTVLSQEDPRRIAPYIAPIPPVQTHLIVSEQISRFQNTVKPV